MSLNRRFTSTCTSIMTTASNKTPTLYFAYGSNLWLKQMALRCPSSTYLGLARLSHWRWIINHRGYANVVPSDGDEVWGMIYALPTADEESLDVNEAVPVAYGKQMLRAEVWFETKGKSGDTVQAGKQETVLCYVDDQRVEEDKPKQEYVHRMNMGIRDALGKGMPQAFVHKYLRPFIPEGNEVELEKKAVPKIFGPQNEKLV